MRSSQVSREIVRAMSRLSGLELGDEQLEELLPQVQRTAEAMDCLDILDLHNVEPAITFKPEME